MSDNTIPNLREYWPGQGGRFAGIIGGEGDEPAAGLVLVCDADGNPIILTEEYGCYGVEVEGASNRRNGAKNQEALLKTGNSPLAKAAAAVVSSDGQTDCYPAALAELQILNANFPEFDGMGWVLSSTQVGANSARYQYFEDGYSYWSNKNDRT